MATKRKAGKKPAKTAGKKTKPALVALPATADAAVPVVKAKRVKAAAVDAATTAPATPAKKPPKRPRAKSGAVDAKFPVRVQEPLPADLRGELPQGVAFETLVPGAPFRYHGAVERGHNEVWTKVDARSYGPVEPREGFVFPYPEGALVLPA